MYVRTTLKRVQQLPGKVRENERPFFRRHLILLGAEFVEQLFAHRLEDELQQRVAENHGRLMSRQTVAECRHVAVAQPPGE